jgi:hypothetical protein
MTIGDLSGAILAVIAIVALRFRLRLELVLSWSVIAVTIGDVLVGLYQRSIDPPRHTLQACGG